MTSVRRRAISQIARRHLTVVMFVMGLGSILGTLVAWDVAPFAVNVGSMLGAAMGVIPSLVVSLLICRKPFHVAFPIISLSAAISVIASMPIQNPFRVGLLAIGIVVFTSLLLSLSLSSVLLEQTSSHRCRKCDYCLLGNTSGICPECGEEIVQASARPTSVVGTHRVVILLIISSFAGLIGGRLLTPKPLTTLDDGQLIRTLATSEVLAVEAAVKELTNRGTPLILRAIQSHDPQIRRNATLALGQIDCNVDPYPFDALCDRDEIVRTRLKAILLRNVGTCEDLRKQVSKRRDNASGQLAKELDDILGSANRNPP